MNELEFTIHLLEQGSFDEQTRNSMIETLRDINIQINSLTKDIKQLEQELYELGMDKMSNDIDYINCSIVKNKCEKNLKIAFTALKNIDEQCSRDDTTAWSIASNAIEEIEGINK